MKRFTSFLLVVLMILSFTSCSSDEIKDFVDGSSKKVESALDDAKNAIKNPDNAYNRRCESADEIDAHKKRLVEDTNFKYLSLDSYVQYSSLKGDEKKVYNLLVQAAYSLENSVNVAYLDVKTDDIQEIYDKFIADNPQFFYLGNTFLYSYDKETEKVNKITISFNDGTVSDTFDSNGDFKTKADRSVIKQKISELDSAITSLLSSISASNDAFTLEKALHDYLAGSVVYDTATAEIANSDKVSTSYSFTMYGAICEKTAVCEGYAKAFQYLCYLVGINSTTVSGIANGDAHMWNVVNVDDTWYHTDVTWDSTLRSDRISYDYYNLTKSEMLALDHEIKQENLTLPK